MDDRLRLAREGYAARLVLQIEALKAARDALSEGHDAGPSLRRLAHRLRGNAGMFGFDELGEAAARLEEAPSTDLLARVDELLYAMRRASLSGSARREGVALVVEDDPSVVSLLELTLAPYASTVVATATLAEARGVLARDPIQILVIDLDLPDGDARDLLAALGDDPTLRDVPVVVLSGHVSEAVRQECLALGATEVHRKPMDPVAIAASVRALMGQETRVALELLGDPVTGLENADVLAPACRRARRGSARNHQPWCLALLAIEGWVEAHDRDAGAADQLLQRVADLVRDAVPEASTVCRWERDELAMVLPGWDARTTVAWLKQRGDEVVLAARDLQLFAVRATSAAVELRTSHVTHALQMAPRLLALARRGSPGEVLSTVAETESMRRRVLVADDDPEMRDLLTQLLEDELGVEVYAVADGGEAIAFADDAWVDAFVLDVDMPGADGLTVMRHLRGSERHGRTPVVLVTVLSSDRQLVEGYAGGADDYVIKPFSPPVLVARLKRLLQRGRR